MATAIGLGIGIPFQRKRGGAAPFVGLLDEVPGAVFAASMRLVRAAYSGGLLRVIAYDGATQQGAADIMPYKIDDEYWINLNSTLENLDATAIGRGLTTSDTLADLCSAGVNNYDGIIPNIYSQDTNGNHAVQTSISAMATIVDAGNLVMLNGKPAIQGNTNCFYDIQNIQNENQCTVYAVQDVSGASGRYQIIIGARGGNFFRLYQYDTAIDAIASVNNGGLVAPAGVEEQLHSLIAVTSDNVNDVRFFQNSNELFPNSPASTGGGIHDLRLFKGGSFGQFSGLIQEIVLYNNILESQNDIEANINNAFSIYP